MASSTADPQALTAVDEDWMRVALSEAAAAEAAGEVPVGAVLVRDNLLVARGRNQQIAANDPTGHAEMVALRAAALTEGNYRLPATTLYVTLEPCTMCVGAIVHARVSRVVFGTWEPRAGALNLLQDADYVARFNHRPDIAGPCLAADCGDQLRAFFRARRAGVAAPAAPMDSDDNDHRGPPR